MASRLWTRLLVGAAVLPRLPFKKFARPPLRPHRILVVHHLLLGDALMLTPLLKKLRLRFPEAAIDMLCPEPYLPLFAARPYGVRALVYNPRSVMNHLRLFREAGYDLALVPGDNRWSWVAKALGARWVVAFAGDSPAYKNWPVNQFASLPVTPESWGDITTCLVDGDFDSPFEAGEWPAPSVAGVGLQVPTPYCVLHLGASSPHKHWATENWQRLAAWAEAAGLHVVLSAGAGEQWLVDLMDPNGRYTNLAGRLDLAQLWGLLAGARILICPDTGVMHLARLTGTPTVALFGPGSPVISGLGRFWRHSPFRAVIIPDIPCRDQTTLFKRDVAWVRQCWRGVSECGNPVCMQRIDFESVRASVRELIDIECPGQEETWPIQE